MSQQVLNIFRENLKSLQTLNFAFRDDTGCPNKFWIGSDSGQQKPWFRFRFYRNPKVSVSTETQIEQKPKPKL